MHEQSHYLFHLLLVFSYYSDHALIFHHALIYHISLFLPAKSYITVLSMVKGALFLGYLRIIGHGKSEYLLVTQKFVNVDADKAV